MREGGGRKSSAALAIAVAVIETAGFALRESDGEYHRIAVMCPELGAFIFDGDVAAKRIARAFPALDDVEIAQVITLLDARVRAFLRPVERADRSRNSWVNSWAHWN